MTAPTPIETLESLLVGRYSCRAYTDRQVPRETIERLLAAAQRTASWCNSQPWQVTITSGDATRRFRDVIHPVAAAGTPSTADFEFPREYRGVYLDRRRESGFQLYNTLGITRGDKAAYARQSLENFNFFGAPHVAIITSDEALGVYGAVDCGGYVTSFMLAAQALGLGTVAQAALASHSAVVRQHFGMSESRRVVCGISFGFPAGEHIINSYRTSRAQVPDVATFVD